mgnify:CR=1 FL=1
MTGAGTSRNLIGQIRDLDGVKQAHIVAGEFDIIAEVEAESEHELLSLVTDEIQSLSGVGRTSTCIVLE